MHARTHTQTHTAHKLTVEGLGFEGIESIGFEGLGFQVGLVLRRLHASVV